MTNVTKVAVAWLRKEDWPRWQEIDSELPPYDRWLGKINQAITETERKGIVAEKITVDPDAFMEWCRVNGSRSAATPGPNTPPGQLMRPLKRS